MNIFLRLCRCAVLGAAFLSGSGNPAAAAENSTTKLDSAGVPFIGGVGGVYFFAEPGELVIEVDKCDLNRRDARTELRAILAGPDRQVLQEAIIPDDGKPRGSGRGPVQTCRLTTRVGRKGVYALNITVSQDRYGEAMVWRFRSNCPKFLIETARGHKDARHEEPIVLADPGRPAEVCFWPRRGSFRVELAQLPKGAASPQIVDANGASIATLRVDAKGEAMHEVPASSERAASPWRLHLPTAQATISIDGVTRWDADDPHPDLCCWTPHATSWFPLLENRWLLTPYRRVAFGEPGQGKEIVFQVRNDSARRRTIQLRLEFPDTPWPVQLSVERLVLAPRETRDVTATGTLPARGQTRTVHLRAAPQDDSSFSTYATMTVTADTAPTNKPLSMPLVLKPYAHENEQFGYLPEYPVESQMYFDPQNRPFIRTGTGIAMLANGKWTSVVIDSASSATSSKVSFDAEGRVYVLGSVGKVVALYTSTDGGRTFSAAPIPARERPPRSFDLEVFTGNNPLPGPPPVLRFTQTAKDEKLFWRSLNDLELFVPRLENGRVVIGKPILITRQSIGLSSHSGIVASVVSHGSKVHVIWGEATDPATKVPGVPAYAATLDRDTGRLGERALLGYGAPANDIHNSSSITMDGEGYLHGLGGTHGKPFPYARSLQPNDVSAGWTPAVPAGEALGQTYIGLVCSPDGTLHAMFRLWRSNIEPHPASSHATLAYQRKRPGQPWEPPRVLVVSPFSEYSVYYHRLTIDRRGRLFVSYDYWSTFWFYRNDLPARRRTVLMSPDGGETWQLPANADLAGSATAPGRF
ncbi:MAG: BNR-4 repeat-containing protein [Opitutaceae bacterium]|nr:BNR-4 repeat-containing protein [Opitutaceae bacterium]